MLLKDRTEPLELLILRSLYIRGSLTEKEKYRYLSLEKGFEGEKKFDMLADDFIKEERYIINDLLLEVNNSFFQIDKLIVSQGAIHLIDVKNFEGDYYMDADRLFSATTKREYKNPVIQLKRSETLFRQLLQNLKQSFPVEPYIIFINPEFTLYQAPMDQSLIFPTQVNRFLVDLNNTPSKLNDNHKKLAHKLVSLHRALNPYTILPIYTYEDLQKGIWCRICQSFMVSIKKIKNSYLICAGCGGREKLEQAILRNIEEFKLLFPDKNITTRNIYNWCLVELHTKTICRILKNHYTAYGKTKETYYQ
ncbi:nuclease-related domain-containing protein [Bacillus dakarensis]|uniref:nuclease-related domain-containing protein n=1 Tax=Robertmurraya dakarensis TaxID=1926278 RepID=UPI000980DD8C|nr:nuclease-related domain-containing protein [Bacillus dakarensis]